MKNEKKDYTVAIIVCGIIVSLLAVILGPIFIDEAFQKTASNKWLAVDWEAKDALNYYGTALAFLGTAVFSALALWQNHIFKKANDDHEKMLEDMEKARNMPVLCLSVDSQSGSNVWVKLENKSENIASEIDIEEAIIIDNEGKEVWREKEEHKRPFLINDKYQFELKTKRSIDRCVTLKIKVTFCDKYNQKRFCVFESYKENNTYETPLLFRTKGIDIE